MELGIFEGVGVYVPLATEASATTLPQFPHRGVNPALQAIFDHFLTP